MAIQSFSIDPNAASLEEQSLAVRNNSGGALAEGDLVYVSGYDAGNSLYEVTKAQASAINPKLAQFIMRAALADATSGTAYKSHTLTGQNTAAAAVGDPVYLSDSVAGGYTLTKPSFAQQIVGRVSVVNVSTGEIEFLLLPDSDSGFVRSNPATGEFPVSGVRRDAGGNLEVEYDDVAAP